MERRPKELDGTDNIIVVDGIPQVGSERLEKLRGVISKVFSKFGNITNDHYALDENGHTKG